MPREGSTWPGPAPRSEHPEIGAIVLECTNMPPYAADVQAATGLPVFDITGLIRMVHAALRHGLPPRPA